jgi:hypothetical protein
MSEQNHKLPKLRTERDRRRAARRRKTILWCLVAVLVVGGMAGARRIYRWARAQRAEQFAEAAAEYVKENKWEDAANKYRAALQLDPLGYKSLQGAAHLASRLNRPEALDLWVQVNKLPQATIADKQSYAELLLARGKLKAAEPVIEAMLRNDPDTKTLHLASRYASATNQSGKAIEYARIALKRAPQDEATRSLVAELLANSTDPAQRKEAREILWELADKTGASQRAALNALGRAPELSREERTRLLEKFDALSAPNIRETLLAADLRLQLNPGDANTVYDQTVARWNGSEEADLIDLARWLNLRQQGERVLSLFTVDRARQNNQLLLARLDAMATLQRWDEIDTLLADPDLTLDPSVLESFRARAAQEKNATLDAEMHWNHAISLAASDPAKLKFVANFAEQSQAHATALKAYEQLARIPEQAVIAFHATQRLSAQSGDLPVQRAAAEKIATLSPDDPNARDHLAYLNLLMGGDIEANFEMARDLAEKFPDRLSYRVTAALGYLRKHDPGMALAQFKGPAGAPPIEWEKTPPSWRAVYAATLQANEQSELARAIIATIPADKLSPEERKLIEPGQ